MLQLDQLRKLGGAFGLLLTVPLVSALALSGGALAEKLTLVAAGNCFPGSFDTYAENNPDVTIAYKDYASVEEQIQDALTHADGADVYGFHTLISTAYRQLRDRGYFPLASDPELQTYLQGIYPEIVQAATSEAGVCAIPVSVVFQDCVAVDMEVWQGLGFTEEQLPKTWEQFLSFIINDWPALAEAHEEYTLLGSDGGAEGLLQDIENNFSAYRATRNYEIGFDTPEFRTVLNLFSAMDKTLLDVNIQDMGNFLFVLGYPMETFSDDKTHYLPLSFVEGEQAVMPMGVVLISVNPNSKHPREVLDLLHYVIENLEPMDRIAMCPGANEPIISEYYEPNQQEYSTKMAAYAQRIADEKDEAARKQLEMERDAYDKDMQNYFANGKYSVSPEGIARYRRDVENRMMPIYATSLSDEEYMAVDDQRQRFLAGTISADQYIDELERRFTLSVMEDQ